MKIEITKCDNCGKEIPKFSKRISTPEGKDYCDLKCLKEFINKNRTVINESK